MPPPEEYTSIDVFNGKTLLIDTPGNYRINEWQPYQGNDGDQSISITAIGKVNIVIVSHADYASSWLLNVTAVNNETVGSLHLFDPKARIGILPQTVESFKIVFHANSLGMWLSNFTPSVLELTAETCTVDNLIMTQGKLKANELCISDSQFIVKGGDICVKQFGAIDSGGIAAEINNATVEITEPIDKSTFDKIWILANAVFKIHRLPSDKYYHMKLQRQDCVFYGEFIDQNNQPIPKEQFIFDICEPENWILTDVDSSRYNYIVKPNYIDIDSNKYFGVKNSGGNNCGYILSTEDTDNRICNLYQDANATYIEFDYPNSSTYVIQRPDTGTQITVQAGQANPGKLFSDKDRYKTVPLKLMVYEGDNIDRPGPTDPDGGEEGEDM